MVTNIYNYLYLNIYIFLLSIAASQTQGAKHRIFCSQKQHNNFFFDFSNRRKKRRKKRLKERGGMINSLPGVIHNS